MRLKSSEIKTYREHLWLKQNRKCALCGHYLPKAEAALDHDHQTGYCRAVVHRDCNMLLGKVENFINRWGKKMKTQKRVLGFLKNTWRYINKDYSRNPIHPTHKRKG